MDDRLRSMVEAAERHVDRDRLAEVCAAMVDVPSPTGEERPLADALGGMLDTAGFTSEVQVVEGDLANAVGTRPGSGGGASLLLYAPIDTVTVGSADEDLPWIGPQLRADMVPSATVTDGMVVGLGAQNPKGHGACALVAAEAVAAAGLELAGDLHVGFGGGGMPSDRRRPGLPDGHGAGCAHLVEAVRPDHAVIAKTGWAVSWAEVGLAWFEVEVTGTHTYVGSRHLLPYRSAIAEAGRLAAALDDWFDTWAAERADDLVRPQGVVGAIEGGWARMPAFTPATCRLLVDLRLPPGVTGDEAATELAATVGRLADELGVEARCRHLRTIPGTRTDPDAWVIRSSIAAWEDLEGRPHEPIRGLSGATDANTLRAAGVPTARVGLPKVHRPGLEVDFQLGMNAVDLADMERLCRHLVRVAVDTCARPREETQ